MIFPSELYVLNVLCTRFISTKIPFSNVYNNLRETGRHWKQPKPKMHSESVDY